MLLCWVPRAPQVPRAAPRLWRRISTKLAYTTPQGVLKLNILKTPYVFGHCLSRVDRPYNEDRYAAAILDLPLSSATPSPPVFLFHVMDGHGGDECLQFLSTELAARVETCQPSLESYTQLSRNYARDVGGYWKVWSRRSKARWERMGDKTPAALSFTDDLATRLPQAYLATDYEYFSHVDHAGSTCTLAYLYNVETPEGYFFDKGTVSKVVIAHVGDTRAVLCTRQGTAVPLTSLHHPLNPAEAARLNARSLIMTDLFGEERFLNFANTRAFGDISGKGLGVSAEPELRLLYVGPADRMKRLGINYPDGESAAFIALVLDGVTAVMLDQELVDIINSAVTHRGIQRATPQMCAQEVVRYVEDVGGDDNATCCVVRLAGWGECGSEDRTGALREERLSNPAGGRRE